MSLDDDTKKMLEEAQRKRHYEESKLRSAGELEQHPNTWESDCCGAQIVTQGSKVFCLTCGQECD